ncbi:MAG: universal stress protein [Paracoccaceae bacterium]
MFNHILIPIAPDHEADIAGAIGIAQKLMAKGARLTMLTVLEPVPGYIASSLPAGLVEENRKSAHEQIMNDISGLRGAQAVVLTGSPGTAISEYADEHDCDLIVVASHRPGLRNYFLGSTAARVVRHAPCSVHVLR